MVIGLRMSRRVRERISPEQPVALTGRFLCPRAQSELLNRALAFVVAPQSLVFAVQSSYMSCTDLAADVFDVSRIVSVSLSVSFSLYLSLPSPEFLLHNRVNWAVCSTGLLVPDLVPRLAPISVWHRPRERELVRVTRRSGTGSAETGILYITYRVQLISLCRLALSIDRRRQSMRQMLDTRMESGECLTIWVRV